MSSLKIALNVKSTQNLKPAQRVKLYKSLVEKYDVSFHSLIDAKKNEIAAFKGSESKRELLVLQLSELRKCYRASIKKTTREERNYK